MKDDRVYVSFGRTSTKKQYEFIDWLNNNFIWYELNEFGFTGFSNNISGVVLPREDAVAFRLRFGELRM
jgi:hypothetical protein